MSAPYFGTRGDREVGVFLGVDEGQPDVVLGFDLALFLAARSVTTQIRPAARSSRGSTGRARKPPVKWVVSMHTPPRSMICQTRVR